MNLNRRASLRKTLSNLDLSEAEEVLKKRYNDKEVECQSCHQKVKPIIKRNKLKDNFKRVYISETWNLRVRSRNQG